MVSQSELSRIDSSSSFPRSIEQVFYPGVRVVDFGCGLFPLWGWEMAKLHGITYIGIDRNPDFVQTAKEWIDLWKSQQHQQPAVTIEQGDYFSVYNRELADIVVVNMPEPNMGFLTRVRSGEFAQAIGQRLKPGGGLAIIHTQLGHYKRGAPQIMYHDSYVSDISKGNLTQRIMLRALGRRFGPDNVTSGEMAGYMQHLLPSNDLPGQRTFILAQKPLL